MKQHRKCHKHALTKHHRLPTSIGGSDDHANLSFVPWVQHEAWHILFSNLSAPTIARICSEKWIDPDYVFVCVRKEEVCAHAKTAVASLSPNAGQVIALSPVQSSRQAQEAVV